MLSTIAACDFSIQRYYLPADTRLAETGAVCGFVRWGQAKIPLTDSVFTAIQLLPIRDRIDIAIQVSVPEGTQIRFREPEIRLLNPLTGVEHIARFDGFRTSIYGRRGHAGYFEYAEAGDVLEGKGRNAELAERRHSAAVY